MRFTSYSHGDLMLLVDNHSTPAWAGAGGEPGSSDQLPAFSFHPSIVCFKHMLVGSPFSGVRAWVLLLNLISFISTWNLCH